MNDKEMNFNHTKYFIYNTPKFNNYSFSYKAYLLDIGKRMIDEAWIACYIYKDPIKMEKCLMECVDFIRYIGEYIKNPDKDKEMNTVSDVGFQKLEQEIHIEPLLRLPYTNLFNENTNNDQEITSIEEGLEKMTEAVDDAIFHSYEKWYKTVLISQGDFDEDL